MKTKIITSFALSAVMAASLCGCNANVKPSPSDSDTNSASTSNTVSDISSSNTESGSGTPSDAPATSKPEARSFLAGLADDPIPLSELISIENDKKEQIAADELTEENFCEATADCAYYALPLYPCVTDRESEFDEENIVFKNIPRETKKDYIKVKKGDKIFGFTVSEASTGFTKYSPLSGKIMSMNLSLDGEITLTGYARMVAENEYGVEVGEILLVPVGEVKLPVVRFDEFDGVNALRNIGEVCSSGYMTFTNEFTTEFRLGNKNETSEDITALPTDGSIVKVNVTLYDIEIWSGLGRYPTLTAKFKNMNAV